MSLLNFKSTWNYRIPRDMGKSFGSVNGHKRVYDVTTTTQRQDLTRPLLGASLMSALTKAPYMCKSCSLQNS